MGTLTRRAAWVAACLALGTLTGCGLLLDPIAAEEDAGVGFDGGRMDAGSVDAGPGRADASRADAARADAATVDGGPVDAGPRDAATPDGNVCMPGPEVCNGADDDCDRMTDEGFDFDNDPNHCGGCAPCPAGQPVCVGGSCIALCAPGAADCDGVGVCEVDLRSPMNCGACGNTCGEAAPSCSFVPGLGGGCIAPCSAGETACADACVDTAGDPLHCGGCGLECDSSTPFCVRSTCETCPEGFGDCNGDALDGCETNLDTSLLHCGGCGVPCVGICSLGLCVL